MAVLGKMGDREGGKNYHQACLDERFVQAARPSTARGVTIIRPIPEIAADGTVKPMINMMTPAGPDLSNFRIEPVTINCGLNARFSGLARSSDRVDEDAVNMVFPGLFIRLKGRKKKGQIPPELKDKIDALFEGDLKAPLRNTPDMALVQAIVMKFNDKDLKPVKAKQVVFLTSSAAEAISELAVEASKQGIDIFDPAEGRAIILTPEQEKRSKIWFYNVELGDKVPIGEKKCKELWVPWEKALKLRPFDEQLKAAVGCFGREIVEFAFPEDYARIYGETPAPTQSAGGYEPEGGDDLPGQDSESESEEKAEAAEELQIDTDISGSALGDDDAGDAEEDEAAANSGTPASDAGADGDLPSEESPEDAAKRYEALLDD